MAFAFHRAWMESKESFLRDIKVVSTDFRVKAPQTANASAIAVAAAIAGFNIRRVFLKRYICVPMITARVTRAKMMKGSAANKACFLWASRVVVRCRKLA